jgi:hypothetical protein
VAGRFFVGITRHVNQAVGLIRVGGEVPPFFGWVIPDFC